MAGSWFPIILLGGGVCAMAVLSAIATPDEAKKVVYIEKDLEGKDNSKRKKKGDSGGSGDGGEVSKFHPTTPWGGSK